MGTHESYTKMPRMSKVDSAEAAEPSRRIKRSAGWTFMDGFWLGYAVFWGLMLGVVSIIPVLWVIWVLRQSL